MVLASLAQRPTEAIPTTQEPAFPTLPAVRRLPFVPRTTECKTCPEAYAVKAMLLRLGFHLTFFVPADVPNAIQFGASHSPAQ
jgi:hypothetical protein